jgi:hypothetical protein
MVHIVQIYTYSQPAHTLHGRLPTGSNDSATRQIIQVIITSTTTPTLSVPPALNQEDLEVALDKVYYGIWSKLQHSNYNPGQDWVYQCRCWVNSEQQ